MNARIRFHASRVANTGLLANLVLLLLLACCGQVSAQTVRVSTYDFASAWRSNATNVIEQAAGQMTRLAPDVILLRGVSGWKMCSQLAQALKPAQYRVAVC